jgi:thioredoxin 1
MEITGLELQEKIKNGEKLIVDFWAKFCGPCKVMKPIFEKVSDELRSNDSEVQLYTLDVEENRDLAVELGIRAVPTIKIFNDGNVIETKVGALNEGQIKELVNELING